MVSTTQVRLVQGRMEGNRSKGRPAMRWTDDIKRWTGLVETPVTAMVNHQMVGGL